jgi:hypothetical protein
VDKSFCPAESQKHEKGQTAQRAVHSLFEIKTIMKPFKPSAGMLAGIGFMIHLTGSADPVVWQAARAEAVEAARNSGKLILLLAGRDTCGNCQYMKNTVCETPSVRQVIDANYVCWYCPVDSSTEWYPYAAGLGSFTLPLMCVIDPGDSTNYLDRSTGTQSVSVFKDRLSSHLPTNAIAVTILRTTSSRLRWATESQLQYRVLGSEDLIHWNFVGGVVFGDGSPTEFEDSSTANRCFYRVMGFR